MPVPQEIKHQIYFRLSDIPSERYQEFAERAVSLGCIPECSLPPLVLSKLRSANTGNSCMDIPAPRTLSEESSAEDIGRAHNRVFLVHEDHYTPGIVESGWSFTLIALKDFLSYNDC